jgi:hypothetical protein
VRIPTDKSAGGSLATRLDKTIKRELELGGQLYMVSISPEGVRIVPKGKRKGQEISWETLVSGEAELRRDLNMSIDVYEALRETTGDAT